MAAYATKLAEGFASQALDIYYQSSVAEVITNQDYEGEIQGQKSVLNILTFDALSLKNYTGLNLTVDDITESNAQLITDQQKAYYFRIKSLDKFKSYIKNPEGTILAQAANELKKEVDTHILTHWSDAAAGHHIGTDYTTGTVTVTTGTGAVTGSGTTFTAAMVGKPFKAAGHTQWYRVKSYSSATSIVIEDDSDDNTSAYTGGAIGAGASYTIQANTALQVTKSTIYATLLDAKTKLDAAEIPVEDRFAVFPSEIANLFNEAPELIPAVPTAYEDVVKRGLIGTVAGFKVYSSERVDGNTTDGWHCLAGHRSGITMAMAFTESGVEDLIGNFGKAYKGLTVYGSKVADERRKCLVNMFIKL